MKQENNLLPNQALFILIHAQIGIGIVNLPYNVFLKAGTDSWISVLLTGVIVQLIIFVLALVLNRYPEHTFQELLEELFGKVISKLILFAYAVYFLLLCSMILARYTMTLSTWMMPLTPKWIIVILMLAIVVYAVAAGLQIMSRFFFIASFIFVIYIVFISYALKDASLTFILPIGSSGWQGILAGVDQAFSSFQGYEILLLINPFITGTPKEKWKVATWSNIFVTLYYLFVVVVTIMFLSKEEIELTPEPLLYLVKAFTFKIIERPDLIISSIWIVIVATTIMIVFFQAHLVVQFFVKDNQSHRTLFFLAIIVCLISLIPRDIYDVNQWSAIYKYVVYVFAAGMPILYAILALLRKPKGELDK